MLTIFFTKNFNYFCFANIFYLPKWQKLCYMFSSQFMELIVQKDAKRREKMKTKTQNFVRTLLITLLLIASVFAVTNAGGGNFAFRKNKIVLGASTTVTKVSGNTYKDAQGNKYLKAYAGVNETAFNERFLTGDNAEFMQMVYGGYKYSNGSYVFKDEDGNYKGGDRFFKYEPIVWNVLSVENGRALLVSDKVLANMPFQPTYAYVGEEYGSPCYTTANGAPANTLANNYQYSNVRYWLNGKTITGFNNARMSALGVGATLNYGTSFLADAFSSSEQNKILPTTYAVAGDKSDVTRYNASASGDKLFLLSLGDWETYYKADDDAYNSKKNMTDLVMSQGGMDYTGLYPENGKGVWEWTRSTEPDNGKASGILMGSVIDTTADSFHVGIAPAMFIDTTGFSFYDNADCTGTPSTTASAGKYVQFGSYPQSVADVTENTAETPSTGVEVDVKALIVAGGASLILFGGLTYMLIVESKKRRKI